MLGGIWAISKRNDFSLWWPTHENETDKTAVVFMVERRKGGRGRECTGLSQTESQAAMFQQKGELN